jgi:hypothetical protein
MKESDRWPRVKDIFHSALARAPHERGAFVREECREDSALREDVSRSAAHAEAGGFAETPAIAALARAPRMLARLSLQPWLRVLSSGLT